VMQNLMQRFHHTLLRMVHPKSTTELPPIITAFRLSRF
jgi:hypothetical protein